MLIIEKINMIWASSTKFFLPFMPKQRNSGLSFYISILYFGLVFLYHLKTSRNVSGAYISMRQMNGFQGVYDLWGRLTYNIPNSNTRGRHNGALNLVQESK